ncbi:MULTISPECIES: hypothetical protein [unclassified Pseudomonas]|uniref:hypothetical protein n=1 Tax=unclassified Pseudomonas TaxID=196821 RepID=UPI0012904C95|nr:hypothetical protein [Pseudomonas sp. MF4836]
MLDQSPLPTPELQDAWAEELHAFNQVTSPDALAFRLGRTGGWISALLVAQVIDNENFEALEQARQQASAQAIRRLKVNTP